eukprot:jgi/Chrzof1/7429/Cz02g23110.t1
MNRNIIREQGCLEGQLRAANQQKQQAASDLEAEKCCVAEMRLMLEEADCICARSQEVAAAQLDETRLQMAAMAEQLGTMQMRLDEVALQARLDGEAAASQLHSEKATVAALEEQLRQERLAVAAAEAQVLQTGDRLAQVEADAKAATRAMLQLQQELGVVRLLLAQKEQAAARQAKALEEQVARADAAELKVLDLEAYVSILRDNMAVQRKKAQEDGYESQLTDMGLRLEAAEDQVAALTDIKAFLSRERGALLQQLETERIGMHLLSKEYSANHKALEEDNRLFKEERQALVDRVSHLEDAYMIEQQGTKVLEEELHGLKASLQVKETELLTMQVQLDEARQQLSSSCSSSSTVSPRSSTDGSMASELSTLSACQQPTGASTGALTAPQTAPIKTSSTPAALKTLAITPPSCAVLRQPRRLLSPVSAASAALAALAALPPAHKHSSTGSTTLITHHVTGDVIPAASRSAPLPAAATAATTAAPRHTHQKIVFDHRHLPSQPPSRPPASNTAATAAAAACLNLSVKVRSGVPNSKATYHNKQPRSAVDVINQHIRK